MKLLLLRILKKRIHLSMEGKDKFINRFYNLCYEVLDKIVEPIFDFEISL